jgi:hypothetical protein
MSMYQVYAREAQPEPESPGLLERLEPPQPGGEVHAVSAGSDATMCGLSTEGMFACPRHVWESFEADGAGPAGTAAIAAHDD